MPKKEFTEPEAWPGARLKMIPLTEEERLVWERHDAALHPEFDPCAGCEGCDNWETSCFNHR